MSDTASTIERQKYLDDFERIITVSQIVGGFHLCHCGADAVLWVDTEPDHEPGATCYEHAWPWIDLAGTQVAVLFGPKEKSA